tara:strand:+ start:35 stop:214 length:180 start_codon:yes stop_codon:yes gene_type:complete
MKIKKNKKALNLSKRKFNIFFLINILFFSFCGNSLASKIYLKRKKVKYKDYVWLLNEND